MQGNSALCYPNEREANMGNATQQTAPHAPQFYRLSHVKQRLGVSSSSIWAWVKAGKFPKPIKLSANTTAWNAADVDAWASDRIAASQTGK
jgi:prophage regulatory protein